MKKMTLIFIKFFNEERHADAFLKGDLYCNKIGYFKNVEDDEQRGDQHEAVAIWLQPKGLKMAITVNDSHGNVFSNFEITESGLAAPVSISSSHHERFHIFCMYAMRVSHPEEWPAIAQDKKQLAERLNAEIQVDRRCCEMGKYAVMIDRRKFLERVKNELTKQGLATRGRLVEYYDDETFSGEIPGKDIIFSKQKRFAHQNEYRIAFDANELGDGPKTVNIGSIADFASKVESSKINGMIKIHDTAQGSA